jgi:IclR-like helix-turn-helix domain-containing protein
MTNDEQQSISITLSPAQVDMVVRAASNSRAPSVSTVIGNALRAPLGAEQQASPRRRADQRDGPAPGGYLQVDDSDPRLSRSLLRGLSILTCFGPDGGSRGIVELARHLGMSPSTTHRYASTLVELGLLERCPKSRKYRLPGTA